MRSSTFLLTAFACGLGVAGALQADHFFRPNREKTLFRFNDLARSNSSVVPVLAEPTGPAFDFTFAAQKASPSVVSIDRYERTLSMFNDSASEQETGTGSGVIVSADGTIVTNNHVVAGIEPGSGRVMVRLSDKRAFPARVLGTDLRSDLAVIKIEAKDLVPIELSNSANVKVGQWVLAVGNPLGFDNTVSVGVVSSLKRNVPVGPQGLVAAIQTDAAINPGNSGGALCDAQGRLIGINSAIASSTGQSVGIGFAIPVDRVKKVTGDIVKYGRAKYAGLGVSYLPAPLQDPRARSYVEQKYGLRDLPNTGFLVDQVSGAAAAAGMQANDVLIKVNGQKLETPLDLSQEILDRKAGDVVTVEFWRQGRIRQVKVTLQELPTRL